MTPGRLIVIAGFALLAVASAALAAPPPSSDDENGNAALKERIAALEARVKMLEKQLRDARAGRNPFMIPPPAPRANPLAPRALPESPYAPIPGIPAPSITPREGWTEREINGIRFYLVPLTDY